MIELSLQEIREIQLNILDYIHDFCSERSINYSLGGGSLLGAVRHQGYIPWDDDIDIMMPREDYDIFIREFQQLDKNNLKLHHISTQIDYPYLFAKVSDSTTILRELNTSTPINNLGINIDIFPIDGLPTDMGKSIAHMKSISKQKFLIDLKSITYRNGRRLANNRLLVYFIKLLTSFVSNKRCIKEVEHLSSKYKIETSTHVACLVGSYGLRERCTNLILEEFVDLPFEDRYYKAICGYKEYLTNLYGHYMQLPPVDQRKTHHSIIAFRYK